VVLEDKIRISRKNKRRLIRFGRMGESYNDVIARLLDITENCTTEKKIIIPRKTEPQKKSEKETKVTITEEDIKGTWDADKAKKMGW